ncbi:MAG: hypothetical protein ACK5MI_04455 [Mangrovibacterium sp.]
MDTKEGAQRLIDFYGIYPMVAIGANGIGIYNEDLSSPIANVPVVKNNFSIGNVDEEANDMISLVSDSLIAVAEGANGIMFKYIKDGDITKPENIINAGGLKEGIEGSPNAICSGGISAGTDAVDLFVAAGTAGVTYIATAYGNRWERANSFITGTIKDLTPTIELEFDQKETEHVIPGGRYKGSICSVNHNYTVDSDFYFVGDLDLRNGSLSLDKSDFTIDNGMSYSDKLGMNNFRLTDSKGKIFFLFVTGDVILRNSHLTVWSFINGYNNCVEGAYGTPPNIRLYGSYLKPKAKSKINNLELQKDDISGDISELVLHGHDTEVIGDATIGADCEFVLQTDEQNPVFNGNLTMQSNAVLRVAESLDTGDEGGQNSVITIKGTLSAKGHWIIRASPDDNLKIKAEKFEGYNPFIDGDGDGKTGGDGDAKWEDILVLPGA